MATHVQLRPEDLAAAVKAINQTYGALSDIQTRVKGEIAPMLDEGATSALAGQAGQSFRRAYYTYDKAVEGLYRSLDLLGTLVNTSNKDYQESEDINRREIDLVDIPTPGNITAALA
jgi:uncharacterized protein YukE